ncbi:SAM-dependent DNA methyltransferase [Salmonella enterica subsp. enterica serovar Bonariensis]|nr:SAM-dependent DNA methyltransferase [Salmonella enterica]EAT8443663.1 SAM-dependent DNA methyltransferase [Salmonella enterica subsp. enterica serovar Bonariensis]EDT7939514.1 N-6 DNA methylase [Salmonella enterica subsp. enterica serovar Aba]EHQ1843319.1 N-6 DNA methylase [Salmonella enterica subsp. enterica serovar Saintpaul]EBD4898086.1 SAM-dependent DNA methyltransferase [Salmonella enterica]
MSRLSFSDVFNMARESAGSKNNIQDAQPGSESYSSVQRLMSAQYSSSRFISVFKSTGCHLGRWEVFSDFLSLAASELDIARIRTPESIEHCRKICARYEASDIANMQEMFCLMVCALEAKFHDFLGAIFMELELGDNFRGQYFTPYHVQSLLARLLMQDVDETIRREGFVTVSDPESGAAGMIVAYAEYLLEAGYNPSEHMFGSCIDIDPVAADMAFIQLSLLGIPAEVVTGNTLTMQLNRVRYTPVYYINNFGKRLDDQRRISAMREFLRGINEAA